MTTTAKAYKGMGMEGSTARWYDRTTRKDMPEFKALAVRIAETLPPSAQVLEVAPGPGFLSIELARRGLQVRAFDISKTFVEIARRNAAEEGVSPQFRAGQRRRPPGGRRKRGLCSLPCSLQELHRAGQGDGGNAARPAPGRGCAAHRYAP